MQPSYFSGFEPISSQVTTQLIPEAKPYYFNSQADAVVICVHGFTGTTYEVYPAIEALASQGLAAVAPLLPGHGDQDLAVQKQKLAQITPAGMLAAARAEIAKARVQYKWVGMFGFSMGGAIALSMAAEGLLDACAVAAPAIRLPRNAEVLIPLLSWAQFYLDAPVNEPFYLPGYQFLHSRALRTLWQLARHGRKQLPQIHCPVFAVHSQNDPTVPPVVLSLMQQRIPQAIQTAWFNDSGHVMLRDVSGAQVASAIAHFFSQQFG
jgi:carboxylesterase